MTTIPFLGGTAAIGAIVAVLADLRPSGLGVREASMYALLIAVTKRPDRTRSDRILNRLTITVVEVGLSSPGSLSGASSGLASTGGANRAAEDLPELTCRRRLWHLLTEILQQAERTAAASSSSVSAIR